jgi:hypothetical protein
VAVASGTAKIRFDRADRDLVRVFKTEFLLRYLSEPPPRARIRLGALKVEQRHAPARDVYCRRRDGVNAGALREQTRTARLVSSPADLPSTDD